MDDLEPPPPEPLFVLWPLALVLALLACHVALGFTREARRQPLLGARAWRMGAAVLGLGTGVWAAMALAIASQPMAYSLGFRPALLAAAWAAALGAAAGPVALMTWRPAVVTALGGAIWFAGLAALAQAMMLLASGPEPGLAWDPYALAMALAMGAAAATLALRMAHLGPGRAGRHRRRWRWLAAALWALGLLAGQAQVQSAGDLSTQIASAHALALGLPRLTLLAAVLPAGLLGLLAGVLHFGRHRGGGDDDTVAPAAAGPQRRRHRRRRSLWRRLFP